LVVGCWFMSCWLWVVSYGLWAVGCGLQTLGFKRPRLIDQEVTHGSVSVARGE
jgi:hypothetical protein